MQGKVQHKGIIARTDNFSGWRKSVTVMTSLWSDGSRGPLAICIAEGFLKPQVIEEFNSRHRGTCYIFTSYGKTHFMSGESLIRYMKGVLTDAFALQRAKHSLSDSCRGLLLYDAWTGYHTFRDGLDLARLNWSKSVNVVLGDLQVGGWSANAQPCDQIHHLLRARFELVDCEDIDCSMNLRKRKRYDEHPVLASGQLKRPKADGAELPERTYRAWLSVPGA